MSSSHVLPNAILKKKRDIFDQIPSPPPKIADLEQLKGRDLSYVPFGYGPYTCLPRPLGPSYAATLGMSPRETASLAGMDMSPPVGLSPSQLASLPAYLGVAGLHSYPSPAQLAGLQLAYTGGGALRPPWPHPASSESSVIVYPGKVESTHK